MNIKAKLETLSTTYLSDATKGLNNLDPAIRQLDKGHTLCGQALTVRLGVNDNKAVLRAIRQARLGQVLVVDSKGAVYNTIAGDFVVGMAKIMGLAGIVADGVVRDIDGVKAVGLPIFCRGTTVAGGGKSGQGEVNVPISCGGVPILPGDWVVGDADGVTVVSQDAVHAVITDAEDKERKDRERSERVLASRETVCAYLDSVLA